MILLAIAGSLPEIDHGDRRRSGHLGLAAGNLIGGIAIQMMVLVVCNAAASGERPLTFLVGSLVPVDSILVVVVFVLGMIGLASLSK
jgi:cation:H+ antiporter